MYEVYCHSCGSRECLGPAIYWSLTPLPPTFCNQCIGIVEKYFHMPKNADIRENQPFLALFDGQLQEGNAGTEYILWGVAEHDRNAYNAVYVQKWTPSIDK